MNFIRKSDALVGANNDICKTLEYSFDDKDIDLGIATIKGRYPESGFCVNLICKELFYVLDGSGEICIEDEIISFHEGDAILVDANKKYYLNSNYCKLSMTCTPAWSEKQHKNVQ